MSGIIMHPLTDEQLSAFQQAPAQAIMLVGPSGSGKMTLASQLAEAILSLPPDGFKSYSYGMLISPVEGKAIGIESVRELEHFLSLKVPGKSDHDRIIIVEDSHLLTLEAQNALLKTLEEPPEGTIIILTANHEHALLPTIRSRVQPVMIQKPDKPALEKHFTGQGFDPKTITQAYAISGGLPGLMSALLNQEEHPLLAATEQARQLLSQPAYERLLSVDALSKQRSLAIDTVDILQQMAHISLQTVSGKSASHWQAIQAASYEASAALRANGQPKLVLTNLVLQF